MLILVDVHEQRSGIAEGLEALGAHVGVTRLDAGDYLVGAGTIVERKRVADLHSSVARGRFWPQLARLKQASRRPFLLLEGTDIDRGSLHPAAVRSICLAVIDLGVPLLRSYQQRDSAIWLYRLALRCQSRGRPPSSQARQPRRPAARQGASGSEALLAAVPGISSSCARALLDRFGNLRGLAAAGPEAWVEVRGIGPERARALAETLSTTLGRNGAQTAGGSMDR